MESSALRRLAALFMPLLALLPASGQSADWHAGIAKVTVRADLNREPGTAFVVAVEEGTAFLVTAAHVVEGDPNPQIEFVAVPRRQYKSTVRHVEGGERRGLALLEVASPPASARVLQSSASTRPSIGQRVNAAGFPAAFGSFTVIETTVATFRGRELVLGFETGQGFSGGPVLADGAALGMVFGREPGFGLAIQSAEIRTYLDGQGLVWGRLEGTATESARVSAPQPAKPGEIRRSRDDGLNYVWIPPGDFTMGCSFGDNECLEDEKPQGTVRITRGFWMGQIEVTVAAYRKARLTMPAEPVLGQRKLNPQWGDPEQPIAGVTWTEAKGYCETFSKGRLPTEAEWEYGARAGSTAARYGELSAIAWFAGNSSAQPLDADVAWRDAGFDVYKYLAIVEKNGNGIQKAGKRQPNAWGLYDMLGNILEWTADWYKNGYPTRPSVDPQGPDTGTERVLRGGSWYASARHARASSRHKGEPGVRTAAYGFRCVRETLP